jgi:hypothetical protein
LLKPVSILSLDDTASALASAVQQRVAAMHGLDDLVQARAIASLDGVADAIQSIHVQRQRPESPLLLRDDISSRELVLLILSAAQATPASVLATAAHIRELYETRRLASYFTIEIVCLLPEVSGASGGGYAPAYALLASLSAANPKPFDEVWLIDATNARRVKFGPFASVPHVYADAIAGALAFEPEMSGALPGVHPRGMPPVFSTLGYAELVFPRDAALQRLEPRFASELVQEKLLAPEGTVHARLAAKQFVVVEPFAAPLARIGRDAGQSLFKRFQPKAQVTENTRSAEEVIAAVRGELTAFRDTRHMENLATLARQGDETGADLELQLTRLVDETLDRNGYAAATSIVEALLDPVPDARADGDASPRNLVTEITAATAALDARLGFVANVHASTTARKRLRELDQLLSDQTLVADAVAASSAESRLAEMESEKSALLRQIPEILFAEEGENNAARNTARDAETARLAGETAAREQALRELMSQKPRAEQALREALEERRTWLWRQVLAALLGVGALFGLAYSLGIFPAYAARVTQAAIIGLSLFAAWSLFRYVTHIAPRVRETRDALERLKVRIDAADKAKNAAHNAELELEYDVAYRRATLSALRRVRDAAKQTLDVIRARRSELESLFGLPPPSLTASGLAISIADDEDVDAWYERKREDRKPFAREFPITRSESRRLALDVLRQRIAAHSASAFTSFRSMTLAVAATSLPSETKLAQRMKRFIDVSAPLVDLRDDDLPAQEAMQRDVTVWTDRTDAVWLAQLQRRFPEGQLKDAPDGLHVHVVTRALHFPGYLLGQIDYYRAQFEAGPPSDCTGVPDLIPAERAISGPVRAAYEQVLLGRAVDVVTVRDGKLLAAGIVLGDSSLGAAQRLASSDGATLRERLDSALAPRLTVAREVEKGLAALLESASLSSLERTIVGTLVKRYAAIF